MRFITCTSLKEVKDFLKSREGKCSPDNTILVSMSCVIHPDDIPEDYMTFLLAQPLYVADSILNLYYQGDDIDEYQDRCMEWWSQLPRLIYINEVMYRAMELNRDIVWFASEDEAEFKFVKILSRFIETAYHIEPIRAKKVMKGKKAKKIDADELVERVMSIREECIKKADHMNIPIHPLMYIRFSKKKRKNLPKPLRKVAKLLEERDWKI